MDWIAARTIEEAKDHYAKLCGFTCEQEGIEPEPVSLDTEHLLDIDNPDLGRCTLLESLKGYLVGGGELPWEISVSP